MNASRSAAAVISAVVAVCTVAAALVVAFFFMRDELPALRSSVFLLAALSTVVLVWPGVGNLAFLSRLSIALYALPFSALAGYLFIDDYLWWDTPLSIEMMSNDLLMRQLVAVGMVGLLALAAGIRMGGAIFAPRVSAGRHAAVLSLPQAVALVLLAVALSWLSAPTATIFKAAYASQETVGVASRISFHSAYLISYLLAILLMVDAERDSVQRRRRLKMVIIALAVVFIVVYLQLLRGDRESIGLIAAASGLYLTSGYAGRHRKRLGDLFRRMRKVAIPALVVVLLFIGLGAARFTFSDESARQELGATFRSGLTQNTWTAVLLTNLSVTARYNRGEMDLLLGRTYLDYFLSLPPGVIARVAGYERPVDAMRGPNWWSADVASGGIHIVLVPFHNFGIFGPLLVLFFAGIFLAAVDARNSTTSMNGRYFFGGMVATSFFWFWYGDMNLIRGVMIVVLCLAAYRVLLYSQLLLEPVRRRPAQVRLSAR